MKLFLTGLVLLSAVASCSDTDASASGDPTANGVRSTSVNDTASFTSIQWIDSTYQDIGKVKEGVVAEVSWRLKNAGTKPLVIEQAQPGCGCTVAEKPEEPIVPGGESVIRGKFNSSGQHVGEHRKYLSVLANTTGTTQHQLQFRAEVVK